MFINPYFLASTLTIDSVILGKQKNFPIALLMLLSGLFHVFFFSFGLYLGNQLVSLMGSVDHWLVLAVFSLLGLSCLKYFITPINLDIEITNSWIKIFIITLTLSIDAAAVGAVSKGIIETPLVVIISIGILSPLFVLIGRKIRNYLFNKNEKLLKLFEGILYLSIGIGVVVSHLKGGF